MAIHSELILICIIQIVFGLSNFYFATSLNSLEPFVTDFAQNSVKFYHDYKLSAYETSWVWSLTVGFTIFGALVGSLCLSCVLKRLGGRDTVMIVKNVVQITASYVMYVAVARFQSQEMLMFGRFLAGITMPIALYIPVFLSECTPVAVRGLISAFAIVGIPMWCTIGTIVGLPVAFGSRDLWQYSLLVPAVFGFIHLCLTPFVPRSAKYLYIVKGCRDFAVESIQFYHGKEANVDELVDSMDKELNMGHMDGKKHKQADLASFREIWRTHHLKMAFIVCVVASSTTEIGGILVTASIGVADDVGLNRFHHTAGHRAFSMWWWLLRDQHPFSNAIGIDIANHYSTGFMDVIDIDDNASPWITVFFLQIPGCIFAIMSVFLIESCGRKALLLSGIALGCVASLSMFFGELLDKHTHGYTQLFGGYLGTAGLMMAIQSNYIGPGTVTYILPGEICPQSSRSLTTSAALLVNFLFRIRVILYPPLQQIIGPYVFLPFVFYGLFAFVFLALHMPETKGKEVDEILAPWVREGIEYRREDGEKKDMGSQNWPLKKERSGDDGYGTLDKQS